MQSSSTITFRTSVLPLKIATVVFLSSEVRILFDAFIQLQAGLMFESLVHWIQRGVALRSSLEEFTSSQHSKGSDSCMYDQAYRAIGKNSLA